MRSLRLFLVATVVCSVMVSSAPADIPLKGGEKILFVGNSLTANGGGLMNFVKSTLASATPSVTVTVDQHIQYATELIKIWQDGQAAQKIRTGGYNIVVLQGWLHAEDYPAGSRAQFIQAVKNFDSVIVKSGAKTVLYMTFEGYFQSPAAQVTRKIVLSYDSAQMAIGGCPVAPCGQAWEQIGKTPPPGKDSTWLFADNIHPNEIGQKLNSYCFYMTLTGRSPIGLPYATAGLGSLTLTRAQDSLLQYQAWYWTDKWIKSHGGTPLLRESVPQRPDGRMAMASPRTMLMLAGRARSASALRMNGTSLLEPETGVGALAQGVCVLPAETPTRRTQR